MKHKQIILSALIALIVFASCKKTWLDVNTNPNQLPTSTPEFIFTSGVARTAGFLDANELGAYWSAQWTQSNTYIISPTQFQFQFNNTNFNFFDTWYDVLEDFQYVIDKADETKQSFYKGPAKVMKAYVYQQLVDAYGDVPYSEALKGVSKLAPKFDKQQDIYEDLIKQLDSAILDIRANAPTAAQKPADIVFAGNQTSWVKFANSLKLRILIRQSRIAGRDTYIIPEINKAAATTEGFLSAGMDVTANPGYLQSNGKMNPYYERWGYTATNSAQALARYPRLTTFLFNNLITNNDTFRLKRFAWPKGGEGVNAEIIANYVGVPYGVSSGYLAQNTSYLGPSVIKKGEFGRAMVMMTAAESFFNLAEAKQRYAAGVTLPSTAQVYYEQGVTESFRLTGATAAYGASTATTLLTSGKDLADWTASPDKLKAIWMQKYIAMVNFSGFEAWCDYRRTNYPVIPMSASAPAGTTFPVRLFYPSTEKGSNPNVPAQAATVVFADRLFWDVD